MIRSKSNIYIDEINGKSGKTFDELIQKVLRSKVPYKAVRKRFILNGLELYFIVAKNPDADTKEPFILLITNLDRRANDIASMYLIRWKIEHCFFHLKSNGFQLESINLQSKSRRKLLMATVVLAYILSIHEGLKTYKDVLVKEYSNGEKWKEKSVFRHGFERLTMKIRSLTTFCRYLVYEIAESLSSYRSPKSINVQ